MNEVVEILEKIGAVIKDSHIIGTSGRHMSIYVSKDSLLSHPLEAFRVTELLALAHKNLEIDVVVAPVIGGVILGHLVAYHLSLLKKKEILSAYAEKTDEGTLVFRRGYDKIIKGKKILIIDDTIATGLSINKMMDVVQKFGGNIVAMGVIVNRIPREINERTLGIPFHALAEIPAEVFEEENCPLCKAGIPINTTVGHGKKFLLSKIK